MLYGTLGVVFDNGFVINYGTVKFTPSLNHKRKVLLIVGLCVSVIVAIALAPETGGTNLLLLS